MPAVTPGAIAIHRGRSMPPPFSARSTVERPRLYELLDTVLTETADTRIISITAPAGSGKTVLLSSWVRRLTASAQMPVAWLTIDESDNDVHVLRAAVTTALTASSGSPALVQAAQEVPLLGSAADRNINPLIGEVLHTAGALCLVIDDAHLLHEAAALDELATLLRWAPQSLRVALAGRFEPPLVLTRLRVAGSVLDITADEMDFTKLEARQLLSRHELDTTADVFDAVMAKTEGWAAGLALAALTAVRSTDPAGTLARFGGTDRAMSDYLVDEFITSLPPATKRVLITTAIPDTVTAAQALYLTDSTQALVILEALTHSNFLITRTQAGTQTFYSYHPMMRAYLRAEAQRYNPEIIGDVRRRTALWYSNDRRFSNALTHAVESGDSDTVNTVIESAAIHLVLGDHHPQAIPDLLDLLDRAPPASRSRTATRLVIASLELEQGLLAPAAITLGAIDHERSAATDLDAALTAIVRAQISLRTDPEAAGAALTDLHELEASDRIGDHPQINSAIALHQAALALSVGELDHAARAVEQAHAHAAAAARSPALQQHCLGARNVLALFTGQLASVSETADATAQLFRTHSLDAADTVHLTQANAAYAASLRCVPAPTNGEPPWSALTGSAVPALGETARVLLGLTDTTAPGHLVADRLRPRHTADRDPLAPHMRALISPDIQHKFLLAGNAADAAAYAAYVRRALGDTAEHAVLVAMVERFQGRRAAAHTALAPVLDGTITALHPLTPIWAWLEETALTADRAAPTAYAALTRALDCAAPETVLRPFRYTPDAVRAILGRNRGRFGSLEPFAQRVYDAVKPDRDTTTVRLSPREMDLLHELPSFRTTESIAADQFISINTVKTHLRGIYRKLGVTNRRDAITAAEKLGLL
ncbi:MAG: LuxR C-terminal-related transcriptional regulator [Rhodococcus sp. (in: high G+C Gram-positive bacteria)]